jgi:hypothetical protein
MRGMIDRASRDRLADAIEAFLVGEIGSFEFDDRIFAIHDTTEDKTVPNVVCLLWHHYDDIKDHPVALSRVEWDYFQRLLLLLRSDASLVTVRLHRWTWRQAIAIVALAGFIVGVFLIGLGWQVLLLTIPLGALAMLISRARTDEELQSANFLRLVPYSSVSELVSVHRTVPGFRKRRYPATMESRRIRGPIASRLMMLYACAGWLFASPLIVFLQALPEVVRTRTKVVPSRP